MFLVNVIPGETLLLLCFSGMTLRGMLFVVSVKNAGFGWSKTREMGPISLGFLRDNSFGPSFKGKF